MPKRYTNHEVDAIVQESQELREYLKNMIKNQRDYVTEMQNMRERNAELDKHVMELKEELTNSQQKFIAEISNKTSIMHGVVENIRPELDWIKTAGDKIKLGAGGIANVHDMNLLNMLRNSSPEYLRDITLQLERGERMHRRESRGDGRHIDWSPQIPPFHIDMAGVDMDYIKDMLEKPVISPGVTSNILKQNISSISESLNNLSADSAKNEVTLGGSKPKNAQDLKTFIAEQQKQISKIKPPKHK